MVKFGSGGGGRHVPNNNNKKIIKTSKSVKQTTKISYENDNRAAIEDVDFKSQVDSGNLSDSRLKFFDGLFIVRDLLVNKIWS